MVRKLGLYLKVKHSKSEAFKHLCFQLSCIIFLPQKLLCATYLYRLKTIQFTLLIPWNGSLWEFSLQAQNNTSENIESIKRS